MEDRGTVSTACDALMEELYEALNQAGSYLLNFLPEASLTAPFLDDLTLLTLGAPLRGGANVKKGARGILFVFEAIKAIVQNYVVRETDRVIEIQNAAGRTVLIEFAQTPTSFASNFPLPRRTFATSLQSR